MSALDFSLLDILETMELKRPKIRDTPHS